MDRQLTIADVFNPLDSAIKVQQLDEMRTRSRLQAMQMQEYQKTQQARNDISSMWASLNGQQSPQRPMQQPQPAQQQPGQPPQAQSQQQGQSQGPNPQQMVKYVVSQAQEAISKGDNDTLQKITTWAQNNPIMKPLLDKAGIISIQTMGENKQELVVNLDSDEKLQAYIQKYPQAKDVFTKPGTYLVGTDKGILTKAEPHKGVESDKLSDEQIVHGALMEKLKREPTKQELLKAVEEHKNPNVDTQVKDIGDAIMRAEQPPTISGFGMAKLAAPLKAYLAKQGFNLRQAELDYHATQKFLTTLNGSQQTRMRQAVNTAYESFDKIDELTKQWKGGKFPILNKGNLIAAKNGVYGQDAASIATQLDGQITDVISELGNVYMGGNSPTDHALQLAGKNLQANWSEKVLLDMTKLARTNLQYRQNSMTSLGTAGVSAAAPPMPASQPTAPKAAETRTITRTGKDKSGKKVVQYSDGSIEYAP